MGKGEAVLPQLTGMRAIAAYTVLISHALAVYFIFGGVSEFHALALRLAYFGMSLFFVLSGFVIYYTYAAAFERGPLRETIYVFFVHRFARIYPLYIVSIVVSLVVLPSQLSSVGPVTALAYLTLTQSWFNREMAIFAPSWSISTEWFFYVAFIPLVFVLRYVKRPLLVLALFSPLLAFVLIQVFNNGYTFLTAWLTPILMHGPESAGVWGWFIYMNPLLRFMEFALGALAAKAYLSPGKAPSATVGEAFAGLSVAWCALGICTDQFANSPTIGNLTPNFVYAPAIAILLFCSCRFNLSLNRWLTLRPLVFGGNISYSVYVWSFFAITFLQTRDPGAPSIVAYFQAAAQTLGSIILTTIFAYLSYRIIERPARAFLRSRLEFKPEDRLVKNAVL